MCIRDRVNTLYYGLYRYNFYKNTWGLVVPSESAALGLGVVGLVVNPALVGIA